MPGILEVIVTSVFEAKEAEMGGADRLELVRALDCGGLTPDLQIVRSVVEAVSIPVRVMIRESAGMIIGAEPEIEALRQRAGEIARFPIDGLVLGFIRGDAIDKSGTRRVLEAVPKVRATFHRAFDEVADPLRAIDDLKEIGQIDHILTSGGDGGVARPQTPAAGVAAGGLTGNRDYRGSRPLLIGTRRPECRGVAIPVSCGPRRTRGASGLEPG